MHPESLYSRTNKAAVNDEMMKGGANQNLIQKHQKSGWQHLAYHRLNLPDLTKLIDDPIAHATCPHEGFIHGSWWKALLRD